jgi:glycosyltransferase involved in cell wall biosynthesis
MNRIALLSSEPIRRKLAGIGIRYLEFARRLPPMGFEVVLVSPADPEEAEYPDLPEVESRRFERGKLAEILAGCDAAVAQGQLANDLLLELPGLPVAIDLYDPWLIENFVYAPTLGLDPYRNDHATWVLQMSRGDFFLCSSEEQRTFYLGFLTALGRVNPERLEGDPDLAGLVAAVPFGVPESLPAHQPVLPARPADRPGENREKRLLFGGIYDWYDPRTLLDALPLLERQDWVLYFLRNPNPESTPQGLFEEVEARCRRAGWWGTRVQALDWVPAERRYDLLRDVDVMVAPHLPSLETQLSLRTRFLDALAAGCPVITSLGGAMSRLLAEHDAGWVAPPGDAPALARCLDEALSEPDAKSAGAATLVEAFRWERVLEPLVRFCREPRSDGTKDRFAYRPTTLSPPDPLVFRLRRRIRNWRRNA